MLEEKIYFSNRKVPGNIILINNISYLISDDGLVGFRIHKSKK
jgi:hypothetical protein